MDKIRLLKFLTIFGLGGTEKQAVSLAKKIDRDKFDLYFACHKHWGHLARDIENESIAIDEYPIRRLYGYEATRQQLKFSRTLVKRRIQIVHSYNFYSNVFSIPAARLARVPCVVASIRDLGVYMTPAQCRVQNWVCRMADVVLVNADAIREWLLDQGFPDRKLKVIRNGVDLARFRKVNGGSALRQELNIPEHAPIVVMLARLNPPKGIEYFLKAAPLIMKRCPDAYFLVVGEAYTRESDDARLPDFAYRRDLQERAAQLGMGERIRFTGMRKDTPEILAASTVSVLPSFSEGISNTILESMASGVPVVATHVGGTPEIIRNGHDGLLIPPRDTQAIIEAVCSILENPLLAAKLGAQGRERVEKSFSLDAMVRQTQAIYFELVESKIRARQNRGLGYE